MHPKLHACFRSTGHLAQDRLVSLSFKFAGPCAQGVLDPVIVPCPMSLGCAVLFVLIKDYAFLRASAHESVPLAGYSPATRRLPAGFPLWVATSPDASGLARG